MGKKKEQKLQRVTPNAATAHKHITNCDFSSLWLFLQFEDSPHRGLALWVGVPNVISQPNPAGGTPQNAPQPPPRSAALGMSPQISFFQLKKDEQWIRSVVALCIDSSSASWETQLANLAQKPENHPRVTKKML